MLARLAEVSVESPALTTSVRICCSALTLLPSVDSIWVIEFCCTVSALCCDVICVVLIVRRSASAAPAGSSLAWLIDFPDDSWFCRFASWTCWALMLAIVRS